MNFTILIVNAFCFLILLVLLTGTKLNRRMEDITAERFELVLWSTLSYIILNIVCELFEGRHELRALNYFFSFFDFIAIDLTVLSFTYYLSALLGKAGPINDRMLRVCAITCYIRMGLILILTLTGKMFTIERGHYTEQELVVVPYLISVIVMFELLAAILQNRRLLSSRQLTVILIYISLPVLPIVIELLTDLYYITSMALILSVMLVYVLIQATEIEERRVKEKMLEELSSTDLLTQLNNRRSYYAALSKIRPDQNLGVLFCDINGLKTTNDRFGHQAGDELIRRFSELLKNSFRKEEIFRISGDEFVVLVPNVAEHDFSRRLMKFRADLLKNDEIASVGWSYGSGSRTDYLILAAEESMYSDKQAYYAKTGRPSR